MNAPLPGKVMKIHVKEGDTVKAGESLLIIDSMKMENEIQSDKNGVIKKISVKEGEFVQVGQALIVIE
jgi:pyruvate carboxylase subunit B